LPTLELRPLFEQYNEGVRPTIGELQDAIEELQRMVGS
jgi:hypothetical protein